MKKCAKCLQWKETSLFPPRYDRERGWQADCKECKKAYARQYYQQHPDRKHKNTPEYNRQYFKSRPERYASRTLATLIFRLRKKGFCPLPEYVEIAKKFIIRTVSDTQLVCPYTNEPLQMGINISLDHKIPVSRRLDLALDIDNLQFTSCTYNSAKWNMTDEEFNKKYILKLRDST